MNPNTVSIFLISTFLFLEIVSISENRLPSNVRHCKLHNTESLKFPQAFNKSQQQYKLKYQGPTFRELLKHQQQQQCVMEKEKVKLKLSDDGFLLVDKVFYPPHDFCANIKDETGSLCQEKKRILNKCCPQNEIWDLERKECRKSFVPFRPKISPNQTAEERGNINDLLPYYFPFQSIADGSQILTASQMLPCPKGSNLKIYITEPCSSMLPSQFVEELKLANDGIKNLVWSRNFSQSQNDDNVDLMMYEKCRWKVKEDGIEYETASGLFHRKSDVKDLNHNLYCLDGYFSNVLCYFVNRTTDNEHIKKRCRESLKELLMFCEPTGDTLETEQSPLKAYCLAGIWLSTCPLLLTAAVAKFISSHKNVHSWTLSMYLLSMFFVNINSSILALETKRELGCKVTDFSMKFLYFSTLCWLTSINFGMWRSFRSSLPTSVEPQQFIFNFVFSMFIPGIVVMISYFGVQGKSYCGSQYCVLYSHKTIPFYNVPVIFLIFINLGLFIRTSLIIAESRQEISSVLHKEPNNGKSQLETFRLFTKLFLMTGPIWIIRLVLFFLQVKGLYFTWYGVVLESIFSVPELAFSIMVLTQKEFKKWSWDHHPNLSKRLAKILPCFIYTSNSIEMGTRSNNSNTKSPTISNK